MLAGEKGGRERQIQRELEDRENRKKSTIPGKKIEKWEKGGERGQGGYPAMIIRLVQQWHYNSLLF